MRATTLAVAIAFVGANCMGMAPGESPAPLPAAEQAPAPLPATAQPPAQPAQGPLPPLTAEGVEQLRGLAPAAQEQWLARLEERLGRAMDIVLFARDAQRRKEQIRAQLHGERTPWSELPRMVADLEKLEPLAIVALARKYRIAVFDRFQADRKEYSRRLEAISQAMAAWEACAQTVDQRDQMLCWLLAAVESCSEGRVESLPPLPDLKSLEPAGSSAESPGHTEEPAPASRVPDDKSAEPPLPPTGDRPTAEGQPPEAEPQPLLVPPPGAEAAGERVPAPVAEAIAGSVHLPTIVEQVAIEPPPEFGVLPGPRAVDRAASGLPREPAGAAQGANLADEPFARRSLRPAIALWTAPLPRLEPPPEAPRGARPVPLDARLWDELALSYAPGETVPDALPGHRLAAMLPSVQPSPSRPAAPAGFGALPRERVGLPASWPDVPTEFVVDVDVADLAARVLGVNSALRNLEAELDDAALSPEQWDAQRLARLVDRLENLLQQQRDLQTYCQLVPQRQQFLVPRLGSGELAISQLGRRIFEARTRAAGPEFGGTETQRRQELKRLDELSRRLARLAAGVSTARGG